MFRTHMTVGSPCSRNVNRFQKRDEVAFTPCPTHFSALPSCDFPKCPTKVFRISFSVLRSQYAAVLQPEALVASVSWHSHNTGRFALSSERITHFACIYHESLLPFTPFFYYILIRNFSALDFVYRPILCAFNNKKIKI